MNTLISELYDRDVPEIDWEKLAVDSSSVYDIYTGLKLDETQVKAGRETEAKRMLELEVYEGVSEDRPVPREFGTVHGWTHSKDQDW